MSDMPTFEQLRRDYEHALALVAQERIDINRLRTACYEALKYIPYVGDGNAHNEARAVLTKAGYPA